MMKNIFYYTAGFVFGVGIGLSLYAAISFKKEAENKRIYEIAQQKDKENKEYQGNYCYRSEPIRKILI